MVDGGDIYSSRETTFKRVYPQRDGLIGDLKLPHVIIFEIWQETRFICPNLEINSGAMHGRRDYITLLSPPINVQKKKTIFDISR